MKTIAVNFVITRPLWRTKWPNSAIFASLADLEEVRIFITLITLFKIHFMERIWISRFLVVICCRTTFWIRNSAARFYELKKKVALVHRCGREIHEYKYANARQASCATGKSNVVGQSVPQGYLANLNSERRREILCGTAHILVWVCRLLAPYNLIMATAMNVHFGIWRTVWNSIILVISIIPLLLLIINNLF